MKNFGVKDILIVGLAVGVVFGIRYLVRKNDEKKIAEANTNEQTSAASGTIDCGCGG